MSRSAGRCRGSHRCAGWCAPACWDRTSTALNPCPVIRLSDDPTRTRSQYLKDRYRRAASCRRLAILRHLGEQCFASSRVGAVTPDRALLVGAPVDVDVAAPPLGGVEAAESQSPVSQPIRYARGAVFRARPRDMRHGVPGRGLATSTDRSIKFSSGHGSGLNEALDAFPLCVRCSGQRPVAIT